MKALKNFQLTNVNYTANTQRLTCFYHPVKSYWSPTIIPCEPLNCKFPPPKNPDGARMEIVFSQNKTTNQQYQTTVVYYCPANYSLPNLISSNYSFTYSPTTQFFNNVTAFCEIDG